MLGTCCAPCLMAFDGWEHIPRLASLVHILVNKSGWR